MIDTIRRGPSEVYCLNLLELAGPPPLQLPHSGRVGPPPPRWPQATNYARRSGRRRSACCYLASAVPLSVADSREARLVVHRTGGTGGSTYPTAAESPISHGVHSQRRSDGGVTAASVDNLKFLRDRKADLAFTTADMLADAVNGNEAFKGKTMPLRALALLYANYLQVVTLESSSNPPETIGESQGKVVSRAPPGVETRSPRSGYYSRTFGIDPLTGMSSRVWAWRSQ